MYTLEILNQTSKIFISIIKARPYNKCTNISNAWLTFYLPCSNLATMTSCMSMWMRMHVHSIKAIKHKINPNSNIWQQTSKQTCENRSKTNKNQNLGFLSSGLRMQEQACVHIIKPMYVGKIMRTQVLAQKP